MPEQNKPEDSVSTNFINTHYQVYLAVLLIALITGPLLKKQLMHEASLLPGKDVTLVAPPEIGQWKLTADGINRSNQVMPYYKNADQIIDVDYAADRDYIRLFIATYNNQAQDKEMINVENYLYDEKQWQPVTTDILQVEDTGMSVKEILLKNNHGEQYLIWSWYRSAGHETTKPVLAKLYDLYGIFTGQTAASVIMIGTRSINDIDIERRRLNEFILNMQTEFNWQQDLLSWN